MSGQLIDARAQLRHRAPTTPPRLRVIIADPDGLARAMIRTALHTSQITTVATTGEARHTLELVRYYQPTVLILDTSLLTPPNPTLINQILAAAPATRIITISAGDDHNALQALRAGAIGHLSKDINPTKLAPLITRAAAGEALIPRHLTTPLLELIRQLPQTGWRPLHSRLTTREWEIIELISHGASTQDIADHLVLSPTTIYSHIKNLLRKLNVHTRQDAITAARKLRQEEAWGHKSPHQSSGRSTGPYRPYAEAFPYPRGAGGEWYGSSMSPAEMAGR